MSRAARITVGAVVAGTLAFVALVAGVMAAAADGLGDGLLDELDVGSVDSYATAEVLDVDEMWDWTTVDVGWTTPDGEVVVTYVDWEWTDVRPEVGDEVEVVYDSADPEWAFAADDPFADPVQPQEDGDEATGSGGEAAEAEPDGLGRAAGWVALAALLGLVVTVVVTVVAAVRAPAQTERAALAAGPYGPPGSVGQQYPPAPPYLSAPPYLPAQHQPVPQHHPSHQPYLGGPPPVGPPPASVPTPGPPSGQGGAGWSAP